MPVTVQWWREHRGRIYTLGVVALFGIIEILLFSMQVVNRPDFLKLAATNRIRAELIEPIRGGIYDRHGRLLVENRPSYNLYAHPWTVNRNRGTIDALVTVLGVDRDLVTHKIGSRGWNTFNPATIQRDLPMGLLARLEAIRLDLPGIDFRLEAKRSYPHPHAVHLLGYVGERGPEVSERGRGRFSLVGKQGIEQIYEEWLGGKPGVRYFQVDASGRVTAQLSDPPTVAASPGWDLFLNVDVELQNYAYRLMDGRAGAVVAIDPEDGDVLVLLSQPDYDPALFAGVMPPEVWKELESDPGHPLINRAIQGLYPPGSTFKMVILAAALEDGVIDDDFRVTCNGGLQLGRRYFRCWREKGHGTLGWPGGLQQSCDVFFYTLGLKLGIERIETYACCFGFGACNGIDLDHEQAGLAPSARFLDRKYGKGKWTRGQLANLAIGQGDMLVTPLQLAIYTAAIATGNIVQARLADRMVNPVTGEIHRVSPSSRPVKLSSETLSKLREGLRLAVNEPGGTAYHQRRRDIVIAGKTGTAQNPHGEDHGLFVGYGSFEAPVIAVAVVVEHGEHGSSSAAPVACSIIERYIRNLRADSGSQERAAARTAVKTETDGSG